MASKLVKSILGVFGGITSSLFGKYALIFIISLMPILELRGGLIAASLLDIEPLWAFIVCMVANILIIPFVLFLIEAVLEFLMRFKKLGQLITRFKEKTLKKTSSIEKYGYLGIMLFVAVPLPGSGAWTGCFLAVLLGLDKKKSFLAALLGVFIAGVIMMIFSYGILKGIFG